MVETLNTSGVCSADINSGDTVVISSCEKITVVLRNCQDMCIVIENENQDIPVSIAHRPTVNTYAKLV